MRPLCAFVSTVLLGCQAADQEGFQAPARTDVLERFDATDTSQALDAPDASADEAATDSGEPPRENRVSLVDHDLWRRVELGEDPFQEFQDGGPTASCERPSYFPTVFVGEFAFEVETGNCNYLTFVQPSRETVRAGELVKARLWHFELVASGAAEAHVGIRIGDLVWQTTLPIPSGSGLDAPKWRAEQEVPQGTPIYFHVDNHGANDWVLIELSTGP